MTTILSWNIQNGLGADGVLSLARIADTIRSICDPDIICLQETAINMPLPDGSFADQVAELAEAFKDYEALFGAAMDVRQTGKSGRAQYGNLMLSRYQVSSVFCHALPQPADGFKKQMPRQMIEANVEAPSGPLRVMTTHLEFHSQVQRLAQTRRIMAIGAEITHLAKDAPKFTDQGPYAWFERSPRCVLCGDFNFLAGSAEYENVTKPKSAQYSLFDAWPIANPGVPYAPTCGIFDSQQWPEGSHCRDFMFVSEDLVASIEGMAVNAETAASDHQPLVIKLNI